MSIQYENGVFTLETADSALQMKVDEYKVLQQTWYGEKTGQDMSFLLQYPDVGFSGSPYDVGDERTYSLDTRMSAYPTWGTGDYRVVAAAARDEQGASALDLRYESHQIFDGRKELPGLPYVRDADQTLEITLRDTVSQLRVVLSFSILEKEDVITEHVRFINDSGQVIELEKAASFAAGFMDDDLELVHFHGRHCKERQMESMPIGHNIQTISSRRGSSSHQHNPAVLLKRNSTTETAGDAYGFMLMYSGSFAIEIEKDQLHQIRITGGILPDGFTWRLEPGESFTTPEAVLSYSSQGMGRLSRNFHDLINQHIIAPQHQNRPRPVLINNWEATYFNFDRDKILSIARQASSLGIDMLVLDDGWFGKRDSDHSGLGDWHVNEEKLGGSLSSLIDEIKAMGMQFGIWIEPEMISEDSDLYRTHPDWAIRIPQRGPVRARDQLVLDMANPEVVDYLYEKFAGLLRNNDIAYVKWDKNRSLSDWYTQTLPAQRMKEMPHRYVLGVYDLIDRLTREFPDVLFEGCSGGGGRFDAGMLYYTPQIWTSDDTDAHERTQIQYGTSFFYPVSTMGSHVSAVPNHQTGRITSLEARGTVAMHGSFGYELDLNLVSEEEKEQVKEQVKWYKALQPLIYHGDYYRLSDPVRDEMAVWEYVSKDQSVVLVQGLVYETRPNSLQRCIKLQGLDENAAYRLTASNYARVEGELYTGKALMKGGILLPWTWGTDAPVTLVLRKEDKD